MKFLFPLLLIINIIYCDRFSIDKFSTYDFINSNIAHRIPSSNPDQSSGYGKIFDFPSEYINGVSYKPKFQTDPKPTIDIGSIGSISLKGSQLSGSINFNRDDFDIYYNFRNDPDNTCHENNRDGSPIMNTLKQAVKYATQTVPSYHVVATCTSFGSEDNAKRPQTYTLSYRDVKLGEYEILAKDDSDDKLFGECDLASLYKYMPDTPHFVEKKKTHPRTIPDAVESSTIVKGIQKVKYGNNKKIMYQRPPIISEWEDEIMTVIKKEK